MNDILLAMSRKKCTLIGKSTLFLAKCALPVRPGPRRPLNTYELKGKTVTMAYHEVPPEVLEQPRELVLWARRAIQLAGIKGASKRK
jgi:hypothetical protein